MLFLDVREPYLLEYPAIADSLGIIVHICGLIYIIIFWYIILKYFLRKLIDLMFNVI